MKKFSLVFLIAFLLTIMSGCSFANLTSINNVENLEKWSFQYNEETNDYSLFFALTNKNGYHVSSDAEVDIRIVNSFDETVYQGTKSIAENDFDYYSSQARGEMYLANLKIPADEINPGKSSDGTIYFTVYNDNKFKFDECKCDILYKLPIKDFKIVAESLPVEVQMHSFDGSISSKLRIDNVDYKVDTILTSRVGITISGEKIYGTNDYSSFDAFNWKVYDSEGYMIKSGTVMLNSLSSGDKFRDTSINLYDLIPGEEYTIKFSNFDY